MYWVQQQIYCLERMLIYHLHYMSEIQADRAEFSAQVSQAEIKVLASWPGFSRAWSPLLSSCGCWQHSISLNFGWSPHLFWLGINCVPSFSSQRLLHSCLSSPFNGPTSLKSPCRNGLLRDCQLRSAPPGKASLTSHLITGRNSHHSFCLPMKDFAMCDAKGCLRILPSQCIIRFRCYNDAFREKTLSVWFEH